MIKGASVWRRYGTDRMGVVTGAPCSGETSVVRELQRRGHRDVKEVARQ